MKNKEYVFKLVMKVRDYECDIQGVVNNANYLHYMEHTRHEFWQTLGEKFDDMHNKGVDAYVYKTTIVYKQSLRSGDIFTSAINFKMKGAKLIFEQDIIKENGDISSTATIEIVTVQDGKITRGEYFYELLKDYL